MKRADQASDTQHPVRDEDRHRFWPPAHHGCDWQIGIFETFFTHVPVPFVPASSPKTPSSTLLQHKLFTPARPLALPDGCWPTDQPPDRACGTDLYAAELRHYGHHRHCRSAMSLDEPRFAVVISRCKPKSAFWTPPTVPQSRPPDLHNAVAADQRAHNWYDKDQLS